MDFIRVSDACLKSAMTALRDGRAIQPAYRELIAAAAAKGAPFLKQKKAAELDAGADAARAEAWLKECLLDEPPKPNIKSFWFGLYETSKGWTLYAAGSTKAIDFRSINWAVDPAWFPRKRYFQSTVLGELGKMRPKKDYEAAAVIDLGLIFPYGSLLMAETLRRVDPALLLGKAKARAAACGYDDGDS